MYFSPFNKMKKLLPLCICLALCQMIKAQEPLFSRIDERIKEIERLRSELKDIITTPGS